jgi:hypothetical protein
MDKVIGALKENNFIIEQQAALQLFKEQTNTISRQFS